MLLQRGLQLLPHEGVGLVGTAVGRGGRPRARVKAVRRALGCIRTTAARCSRVAVTTSSVSRSSRSVRRRAAKTPGSTPISRSIAADHSSIGLSTIPIVPTELT